MNDDALLEVDELSVEYWTATGRLRAVDRVCFSVGKNEMLGLAGESGSGKSTLAQSILRVLNPPGVITGGALRFQGQDILSMDEPTLRSFRWSQVAMVFQSAMNSLNPVLTIQEQILDTLAAHHTSTTPFERRAALARAKELLAVVGLDPARLRDYPHQLSGGMRQRVVIAIALALSPDLLILDEPTTALDVVVQREILQEIVALQRTLGFSVLFITHDLPLMLQVCDRVGILYGGRLCELAPVERLRREPQHPYTQGLMKAFPSLQQDSDELRGIEGEPLRLASLPSGCRFHPRCPHAEQSCRTTPPALEPVADDHLAACHLLCAASGASPATPTS